MITAQEKLHQAALWSILLSAAAVVLIAECQILLGLALVTPIASDTPLRFPPIKGSLAAFLGSPWFPRWSWVMLLWGWWLAQP
jgi:hypothetical protein